MDVTNVIRYVAYTVAGDPASARSEYGDAIQSVGHTVYDIIHDSDKMGMTCYLITAYSNARGDLTPGQPTPQHRKVLGFKYAPLIRGVRGVAFDVGGKYLIFTKPTRKAIKLTFL